MVHFRVFFGNITNTNKISSQLQPNQCHARGIARANNRCGTTPGNLENLTLNIYFVSLLIYRGTNQVNDI
jgi:hypothetical protein